MKILGGMFAALSLTGCGELLGGGNCTTSVEPAIKLEIRDSISGTSLAGVATTTVADWGFTDTLEVSEYPDDYPYQWGPAERGGIYDIKVTAPGYTTWTRKDFVVSESGCHVNTRELLVRLVPEISADAPRSAND